MLQITIHPTQRTQAMNNQRPWNPVGDGSISGWFLSVFGVLILLALVMSVFTYPIPAAVVLLGVYAGRRAWRHHHPPTTTE
jgi:hypothetical protein